MIRLGERTVAKGVGASGVRVWTRERVDKEKQIVRDELDRVEARGGPRARLELAVDKVVALESDSSPLGQLRRYLYAMSALVAHERHGGLSSTQARRLEEVARALLVVRGVATKRTPLATLHRELDLVASQIARKQGSHLDSIWLQQLATQFAEPNDCNPRDLLGLGIRWHRLGFTQAALRCYQAAISSGLPEPLRWQASLGRIIVLRLSGELSEAERESDRLLSDRSLDKEIARDLQWQRHCIVAQREGDLSKLVRASLRGGTHFDPEYRLEAMLWAASVPSRKWIERLPSVRNLPRLHGQSRKDALYQICLALEEAYDYRLGLESRVRRIGKAVRQAGTLISLELELLAWTAAARWLTKSHLFSLATLCLGQYEAHSLRLSGWKNPDVLGVAGDLREKPWYAGRAAAPKKAA